MLHTTYTRSWLDCLAEAKQTLNKKYATRKVRDLTFKLFEQSKKEIEIIFHD